MGISKFRIIDKLSAKDGLLLIKKERDSLIYSDKTIDKKNALVFTFINNALASAMFSIEFSNPDDTNIAFKKTKEIFANNYSSKPKAYKDPNQCYLNIEDAGIILSIDKDNRLYIFFIPPEIDPIAILSNQKNSPAPKYTEMSIGETIKFNDSEWTVLSARIIGSKAKSNNPYAKDATTDGQFIIVQYQVKNIAKKTDVIFETPVLMDLEQREFSEYSHQEYYLPDNAKTIIMEQLTPGMTKKFYAMYEVPSDSKNLKFRARSLSPTPEFKLVTLDFK